MYFYRKAVADDWEFTRRLLVDICELHHLLRPDLFKTNGLKFSKRDFDLMLSSRERFVHICTDEKNVRVGYMFTAIKKTPDSSMRAARRVLYIDDLCIDEPFRCTGAGSGFMRFAENFAKELGCDAIELNCWSTNAEALSFYAANGYSSERIIMEKVLNEN